MSTSSGANPWAPSSAYNASLPTLTLVGDVFEGTTALRAKSAMYLPQFPAEEDAAYQRRVANAVHFNAFRHTVNGAAGMLFRKPPAVEGAEGEMAADLENVDLQGSALQVFAKQVAQAGLRDGVTHVLVDHMAAPVSGDVSRAQVRQLGLRPFWVHIPARALIGWHSATVGGVEVLTQVRWIERATVRDGKYGEDFVERLRVLSLPVDQDGIPTGGRVLYEMFERKAQHAGNQREGGPPEPKESRDLTIDRIPLATFYADRTGFMRARPPYLDLAYENIRHFQARSAHDRGVDVGQYAFLATKGLMEEDLLTVGPYHAIRLGDNGDAKWVEISGNALEAGHRRILEAEKLMSIEGLSQLHNESRAAETATSKRIDKAEQDAQLQAMAESLEDCLANALDYHAAWRSGTAPAISVNKDFESIPLDPAAARVILDMVQSGQLSRETAWAMMVRGEWLPEDFDAVEEEARLAAERDQERAGVLPFGLGPGNAEEGEDA